MTGNYYYYYHYLIWVQSTRTYDPRTVSLSSFVSVTPMFCCRHRSLSLYVCLFFDIRIPFRSCGHFITNSKVMKLSLTLNRSYITKRMKHYSNKSRNVSNQLFVMSLVRDKQSLAPGKAWNLYLRVPPHIILNKHSKFINITLIWLQQCRYSRRGITYTSPRVTQQYLWYSHYFIQNK